MSKDSGFAIWLTGLPASGKTTLAEGVASDLRGRGITMQILDSDELRGVLTPDPTYTSEERDWFYRVVAYIAKLLVQNGVSVLIAATANRRRYRGYARQAIQRFTEVYVSCSLETCMERDEKGIYERAMAGQATTVPGLQVPYEPPLHPASTVDTEKISPQEGVEQILEGLGKLSFLQN